MRERDGDVRPELGGEHRGRLHLELAVHGCEDARDRDGPEPPPGDVGRMPLELVVVERGDDPSVELVAAVREVARAAHRRDELLGPVDERRQRGRGGKREPHGRRGREPPGLDERVDEVRRADHHPVDVGRVERVLPVELRERADDAARHVLRGRGLDADDDAVAVHEHGVRVGAADVDADPHRAATFPAVAASGAATPAAAWSAVSVRTSPTPRISPALPSTA